MPKSSILLLLKYDKVHATPYKIACEMGLEAFQISTCYKMAGPG
jgi:hypothetical protein